MARKKKMPEPSVIIADLYLRSSKIRKDEEHKKVSIKTQKEIGLDYIKEMGWELGEIKTDPNKSGYTIHYTKRQGLMDLLQRAEEGKSHKMVVYKFSRLGRKYFEEICDKFENSGVSVVSATERIDTSTPSGRAFRSNFGIWNRFYSEDLSEWLKDTKQTNAERGKYNGGQPFYGTTWNNELRQFENIPETSSLVKLLFEKKAQGYGRSHCMKMLHNRPEEFGGTPGEPILSPSGAEWWDETTIQYLWKNAKYIGLISHNDLYYGGEYIQEPIILDDVLYDNWLDYLIRGRELDKEEAKERLEEGLKRSRIIPNPIVPVPLWNAVQEELRNQRTRSSAAKGSTHEFAELIWDAKDGSSYQYKKQDDEHPARWICGIRKRRGVQACRSRLLDHDTFLKKILFTINTIALDKNLWELIKANYEAQVKAKIKPAINNKKQLEKKIKQLENTIREIEVDRYENRTLSAEQFVRLNNKYQKELENLKNQYREITNPNSLQQGLNSINNLQANMSSLQNAWEELDPYERRLALKGIIKEILVYESHVTIDLTFHKLNLNPSEIRRNVMFF